MESRKEGAGFAAHPQAKVSLGIADGGQMRPHGHALPQKDMVGPDPAQTDDPLLSVM